MDSYGQVIDDQKPQSIVDMHLMRHPGIVDMHPIRPPRATQQ